MLLQNLPVGSKAEMWFWGGFSSSVCFLVRPAQECGREREGVGELERKTQKKLLGFRQRWGWKVWEERHYLCLQLSTHKSTRLVEQGLVQHWYSDLASWSEFPPLRGAMQAGKGASLPIPLHPDHSSPCSPQCPLAVWLPWCRCGRLTRSPLMPPRGPVTIYWISI